MVIVAVVDIDDKAVAGDFDKEAEEAFMKSTGYRLSNVLSISTGKERIAKMQETNAVVKRYTPVPTPSKRSTRSGQPLPVIKMNDVDGIVQGNSCMDENTFNTPSASSSSRPIRSKQKQDKAK